jgi:restriction endonuclease BglII
VQHIIFAHRFADVILNSDYELKKEVERVIADVRMAEVDERFGAINAERHASGKKLAMGKQSTINALFRERFQGLSWEVEKNVFNDRSNDLAIDFWKRDVGVDVAFNHRSFIGGDLLRLQAAAEVKQIMKVGVYVCGTAEFVRAISRDGPSMVSFERTKWYLENFYQVLTVPILLVGLHT